MDHPVVLLDTAALPTYLKDGSEARTTCLQDGSEASVRRHLIADQELMSADRQGEKTIKLVCVWLLYVDVDGGGKIDEGLLML
jgi:hypothetical protein